MNLGQIVYDVQREIQYAPDIQVHRRDIRNVVNRQYKQLARARKWPWLKRKAPVYAFPDVTLDGGVAVSNSRILGINENKLAGTLWADEDTGAYVNLLQGLNGAEFDLADRGKRDLGNGNWEEAPFVIERAVPVAGGPHLVYLDPRATITAITGNEGNFVLRFPRTRLPVDLDQLIAVRDQNGYELKAIDPRTERHRILTNVTAGTPGYVLEDGGHAPTFPEFVSPLSVGVGANPFQQREGYQRSNIPITNTITATLAGGGTLALSTMHRFFVSWWYGGRFGPPSNIVEATPSGGNRTVALANLPVTPSVDYGRLLSVWVCTGESGGFYLYGFATPTVTTHNVTAPPSAPDAMRPVRFDEAYPGRYQYIRFFPRPSVPAVRYELEFYARPRELLDDVDEPEFEEGLHELLVWATAATFVQRGADAKRVGENLRQATRRYTARYLPQDRYAIAQQGMIGQPELSHPFFTADIDYRG